MKICLSGYEGSKKILGASSYLVAKYLGTSLDEIDVRWLNYGAYDGLPIGTLRSRSLYIGEYVSLADAQDGVESWARDVRRYLKPLEDEFVIFALDDYLLCEPIEQERYGLLLETMESDANIVCGRLCTSEFYQSHEFRRSHIPGHQESGPSFLLGMRWGDIVELTDKAEYSATTQYCIWRRDFLIGLLGQVSTPWEFETTGSQILNASGKKVIGSRPPALVYPDSSALSARWEGVNVQGVTAEDLATLLELGLLNEAEIVNSGC